MSNVLSRNDGVSSTTEEEFAKLKEYCKEKYLLGRGGYGDVYRGKFKDDRDVAIKRIKLTAAKDKIEAELHFPLKHENVVTCLCIANRDEMYRYVFIYN